MLAESAEKYRHTRSTTERFCAPLAIEDFVVQSMPDCSPTRWHLAHSTWFFETFLLLAFEPNYQPVSADYQFLFNSYYNGVGKQFPRARRGLLTRPTVADVFEYRRQVDQRVMRLLSELPHDRATEAARIVELGINHEQQHQELMVTDLKHLFSCNPLQPIYRSPSDRLATHTPSNSAVWSSFAGGVTSIGSSAATFVFDNECPRHQTLLQPFEIRNRLVTVGDFLEFMGDGGYTRPELWLSMGWSAVREQQWAAPLYWEQRQGQWLRFGLDGLCPVSADEPICHVSYFEADAFARWSHARLPTEAEWEQAAGTLEIRGSFLESEHYHPQPCGPDCSSPITQLFGEVWQWTASPYTAYPGYEAASGALGEYNGKFMCNQYVLRGGSCATPRSHIRSTYRNFFPPDARWQFSGIRLARNPKSQHESSMPNRSA